MGGTETQHSITHSNYVENFDATGPIDQVAIPDTAKIANSKTPYEWAFISYFGRFNYSFKNKLNFQLTSRWDGSSRFGKNNRYGFFPAAAVGYILSEEKFMKQYKWINFMKLRAGMGKSGNANFDNYARWGTITPSGNLPNYNGRPQLAPARLENPNLRWESTVNFDAGVEMAFMKGRISTEITYYSKVTSDVIMNVSIPVSTGFGSFYDNVGGITNKGLEFSLKTVNIRQKNFNWTTNFSVARNVNKITSIGVYSPDAIGGGTNDTRVVLNQPVGTNFLVRFSHIDKATGAPVYLDINGKETSKWDPANRVAVGNVLPKAFGNLANTISYKNWELNANIYFNIGGSIFESSVKRQLSLMTDWNMDTRVMDRWQNPGDDALYPKMTLNTFNHGATTPWINTDLWLQDGSYVRLRSLNIGYRLPKAWLQKSKFDAAKVMIVGTNLLTWTRYTGIDPEIARDFENAYRLVRHRKKCFDIGQGV
jgi:TonB-linked SusC/RagA family outer membrane protein